MMMPRRNAIKRAAFYFAGFAGLLELQPTFATQGTDFYQQATPRRLVFPRDYGAHPEYRTEWWYLTGWLGQGSDATGFQLTFFRSRTQHPSENPSRLAPKQLLFAHAAVAVAKQDIFLNADRAGRLSTGSVRAETTDTNLQFEDWYLRRVQRSREEVYEGRFEGEGFEVSFVASTQQPVILRGQGGLSQKGPKAEQASYYYSRAPLNVRAQVQIGKETQSLEGKAWLDHEWSSQLLMSGAVGWDWVGINLLAGGTLMAFQMRNNKSEPLYSHVDARDRDGLPAVGWSGLRWQPHATWRSKSLTEYPVHMDLVVGSQSFRLVPLMLSQEVDARASTGGFYWEGAVSLMQGERLMGRGYLELTGYGAPLHI